MTTDCRSLCGQIDQLQAELLRVLREHVARLAIKVNGQNHKPELFAKEIAPLDIQGLLAKRTELLAEIARARDPKPAPKPELKENHEPLINPDLYMIR